METSTSEITIEAAAVETESSTQAPLFADSPAVATNEPESQLASAELTTDSVTTLPVGEDFPAFVANEPESQPASVRISDGLCSDSTCWRRSLRRQLQVSLNRSRPPN